MTVEKPRCANCGDELSGRGTAGVDGLRYCSYRRSCRQAKYAARRAGRMDRPPETEDRPCSHCGTLLPARAKRSTDLPIGRWCRDKNACNIARREAVHVYRSQQNLVKDALILECPACGLADAREGIWHPAADASGPCTGTGSSKVSGHILREVWPDLMAQIAAKK